MNYSLSPPKPPPPATNSATKIYPVHLLARHSAHVGAVDVYAADLPDEVGGGPADSVQETDVHARQGSGEKASPNTGHESTAARPPHRRRARTTSLPAPPADAERLT